MRRFLLVVTLLFLAAPLRAAELQVSAAASLSNAMNEVGAAFTRAHGTPVRFNFAGSGTLAMQIREGAPVDVFVSADELRMDALDRAGLIVRSTRRSILSNVLVVVVPIDSRLAIPSVQTLNTPAVGRLAVADPQRVPAGTYAMRYLERLRLWEGIAPKTIPTENVRATLAAVESGNVDAGIVYRTDAMISRHVRIAATLDGPLAPAISYPAAVLRDSAWPAAATQFVNYLTSPAARAIFARYGFSVK
jgi:molybdate transport system substrate-binding protein